MATRPIDLITQRLMQQNASGLYDAIPNIHAIAQQNASKMFDYSPYDNFVASGSKKSAPQLPSYLGNAGKTLGMGILDTLGSIGGAITDQLTNWTDGKLDWKDIPLANSGLQFLLGNPIQHPAGMGLPQFQPPAKSDFSMNDVGILGGLANVGKESKRGSDFLQNLGWQGTPGKLDTHDVAGFLLDVAADPLTYLTLGGSSAAKFGVAAAKDAAKQSAKDVGENLTFSPFNRNLNDIMQKAADTVTNSRVAKHTAMPEADASFIKNEMAPIWHSDVMSQIDNAAKQARTANARNLANFDLPFTSVVGGIGRGLLPEKFAALDSVIGSLGGHAAEDVLNKSGLGEDAQKKFLQQRYGVDSADQLTSQALDDLHNILGNYKPTNTQSTLRDILQEVVPNGDMRKVTDTSQLFDGPNPFQHILGALPSGNEVPKLNDLSGILGGASKRANPMRNFVDAQFSPFTRELIPETQPTNVDNLLSSLSKKPFVQDIGNIANASAKNPFNARTLRSSDPFVNEQANLIQDANAKVHSGLNRMENDMGRVHALTKDFTPAEKEALLYETEKAFPGQGADAYYAEHSISPDRQGLIKQAAQEVSRITQNLGERDLTAGNVKKLLPNYFPHVLKKDNGTFDFEKWKNDPEVGPLLGKSQKNRFGNERKSFDSFAQLKNVVAGLKEKASKLSPDSEEYARIQDKVNELNGLFETDPMIALSKRYYTTVRSAPMKELYTQLEKNGMLSRADAKPRSSVQSANFKTLDAKEARTLGLKAGDMVHPEVMDGLKKVQELFTMDGAKKWVRNINAAVNIWKNLVTTFSPKHYLGNIIGNVANTTMAGVGPKAYVKAGKLFQAAKTGKLTAQQNKLLQQAADDGVLNQGFISDFTRHNLQFSEAPLNRLERVEKKVSDMRVTKAAKDFGNKVDNLSRMALYIHALEKTGSRRLASQQVRKYLFNYREMTQTDKVVRLFMPFWNWTKNNLPLQMKELIQKPRFVNALLKGRKTAYDNSGVDQQNTPDWLKENYVPLFGKFINPRLPQQDLNNLADPLGIILGGLTPALKIPLEMYNNKNMFTKKPIDWNNLTGSVSPVSKPGFDYLMKQLGIVGNLYDNATNKTPFGQDIINNILGKSFPVSQQ